MCCPTTKRSHAQVTWCFCYAVLATRWILQDQMHIQEQGAGHCLTSCLLCFRGFLQAAPRGTNAKAEPGQISITRESNQPWHSPMASQVPASVADQPACFVGTDVLSVSPSGCMARQYNSCSQSAQSGATQGYLRRNHILRLLEGTLFVCLACPVVCAMNPKWSVQHENLIALRESSPHILRPAMDPTEVCVPLGSLKYTLPQSIYVDEIQQRAVISLHVAKLNHQLQDCKTDAYAFCRRLGGNSCQCTDFCRPTRADTGITAYPVHRRSAPDKLRCHSGQGAAPWPGPNRLIQGQQQCKCFQQCLATFASLTVVPGGTSQDSVRAVPQFLIFSAKKQQLQCAA